MGKSSKHILGRFTEGSKRGSDDESMCFGLVLEWERDFLKPEAELTKSGGIAEEVEVTEKKRDDINNDTNKMKACGTKMTSG